MTEDDEPWTEPENKTECVVTNGVHCWIWNKNQQIWECDECGCNEDNQELFI